MLVVCLPKEMIINNHTLLADLHPIETNKMQFKFHLRCTQIMSQKQNTTVYLHILLFIDQKKLQLSRMVLN